jgi:hypothetical protein
MNSAGQVALGPMSGRYLEQAASDLGNEGWELVLCYPLPNGIFKFLFKRPT